MKIVIIAPEDDSHTAPVRWALERAGYGVECWAGPGWTPGRQASISPEEEGGPGMRLGPCALEAGDVVWIRRLQPPAPNPEVSEADRSFAQAEYRWFSESLMYLLDELPVRSINRFPAARRVRNKAVQLALARSVGMRVPATLMSNSPGPVREFLRLCRDGAVCKAFNPHVWRSASGDESVAVTETFELTAEMLPDDEVLTYAPAIYQQKIDKQFDVRMVLMGTDLYSAALRNPKGSLDWRQDVAQGAVGVECLDTPEAVRRQVLTFAERAGIVFGSFDFAVDRDGAWWFFEVNEQGQFLWLDELNPGLHLQETFLAFLTSPEGARREEIEQRARSFPSWRDWLGSAEAGRLVPESAGAVPEGISFE